MAITVRAAADSDDVIVAWWAGGKLAGCLGFAVERQAEGGDPQFLLTEMPFQGQTTPPPGTTQPSSRWPVQRFVWTDHLAPSGVRVRYLVSPVEGQATGPVVSAAAASGWTDWEIGRAHV